MICPNCGTRLEDGTKECFFCGYRLDGDASEAGPGEEIPAEKVSDKKEEKEKKEKKQATGSRKKKAGIIGGLCTAGGVAAALIIIFAVTGGKKELTLEEQVESLQAKAETASAEELPSIMAEAEELKAKVEESALASIKASQESEKTSAATGTETGSGTQTDAPTVTQAETTVAAMVQTQPQTAATTAGSLEPNATEQAQIPVRVTAEPVSILANAGSILGDGQYDKYTFKATNDGRYRAEMSGMDSGAVVDLDFYDLSGKLLDSSYGCSNGDGVTVKDLVAGQTYEVVVSYGNMATPYVVSVGMQKRALDISSATEASDSIDYTDQRNLYSFTPSKNGDFRFEIAGLSSGVLVDILAFDDPGNKLDAREAAGNGEGITLKNLKAYETYEIQVRQNKGLGSYVLLVK